MIVYACTMSTESTAIGDLLYLFASQEEAKKYFDIHSVFQDKEWVEDRGFGKGTGIKKYTGTHWVRITPFEIGGGNYETLCNYL